MPDHAALEVRGLVKTYATGVQALKGIDLKVAPGDFFGLLGPNGAGKSTLIGIIATLVNPSDGDVLVFGRSVRREREAALAQIGLVPQEFNFNQFEKPLEIIVNQAGFHGVPRRVALERAEKYLRELGLWEKREQPSRTLSGGMKRRLMSARAMVNEPKLLILDEPTAGVDIEIRRSMWRFVEQINAAGTTVILTTHYLEEAEQLCRNIAIIDHGRIIENTSTRALLRKLDMETFVLDLAQPLHSAPAPFNGFEAKLRDEHSIEIELPRSADLNGVFAQLSTAGIAVKSMRNKSNRLEELFVRLVDQDRKAS